MNLQRERVGVDVDGGSMPGFLCAPASDEPFPGIVVIHEIFGLVPHTEDIACRLAAEGYVALAPQLFWQSGPPRNLTDRESFLRFREAIDDRQMLASLDAAVEHLRQLPSVDEQHIGIVGFCMGGSYSLLEAAHNPSLSACVDFYGTMTYRVTTERRPQSPLDAARDLRVPLLGLFGEEDQTIPLEQVRRLEDILKGNGVPCEIHVYPRAGHGFFNDTDSRYRQHAAEDAWPKVLQFFERYLKAGRSA